MIEVAPMMEKPTEERIADLEEEVSALKGKVAYLERVIDTFEQERANRDFEQELFGPSPDVFDPEHFFSPYYPQ